MSFLTKTIFGKNKDAIQEPEITVENPVPIPNSPLSPTVDTFTPPPNRAKPVRGPNGKFVSTKAKPVIPSPPPETVEQFPNPKETPTQIPALTEVPPVIMDLENIQTLTFFGKNVRISKNENQPVLFNTEDILNLCLDPHVKDKFKSIDHDDIPDSDWHNARDTIKLVQKLQLPFPGPLSRWLDEASIN